MTAAMECEILCDTGHQCPSAQFQRGFSTVLERPEYEIAGFRVTSLTEIFYGSLRNIKVFLATGLLLLEDKPCVRSELLNLAPGEFQNVALSQAGQTSEQESSLELRVFAVCCHQASDLLDGEILTLRVRNPESLNCVSRIVIDDMLLEGFVKAGFQLIEIRDL